jgi:hypothetical protein
MDDQNVNVKKGFSYIANAYPFKKCKILKIRTFRETKNLWYSSRLSEMVIIRINVVFTYVSIQDIHYIHYIMQNDATSIKT